MPLSEFMSRRMKKYFSVEHPLIHLLVQCTRPNHPDKIIIKLVEATTERIKRLLGFDVQQCPYCKKGRLVSVDIIPRIQSPPFTNGTLI
ncbi:MAG: hypothetical protein KAS71_18980 [Bacteroidales bacterium]|nr:hypothetical protein [Bacteroidales bacterium]